MKPVRASETPSPRLVVGGEPVSALNVSGQAQTGGGVHPPGPPR